jgi:hypothetical protein
MTAKIQPSRVRAQARKYVRDYVRKTMDARLDPFVERHMRSYRRVAARSLNCCFPDLLVTLYNGPAWAVGKIRKRKTTRPTFSARSLQRRFTEEVFRPEEFQQGLKRFIENKVFEPYRKGLAEVRSDLERDGLWDPETFEEVVRHRLDLVRQPGESVSKAVVMAVEIGVGSLVYDELTRGFGGAAGVAAAEAIYTSQLGLLGSMWTWVVGMPAWVEVAGMIAGGACAMFLLAPLLGAVIECTVNRRRDMAGKIRKNYQEMIDGLMGEAGNEGRGVGPLVVDLADKTSDALDLIRDAARLLRV